MVRILPSYRGFSAALSVLRKGGLAAIPTETVYGLAADATNAEAVAKIYHTKGRPDFNPLIAHVSGIAMAERIGVLDATTRKLVHLFWPGPLTVVVPLRPNTTICDSVTAGLGTIALRHPTGIMAELATGLGSPIAAPSANSSGRISPTLASHVDADLGEKLELILDSGACLVGLESTIVRSMQDGVHLLREGGLSAEILEDYVGPLLRPSKNKEAKIQAPGMLLAHYAPSKPVRLNAEAPEGGEALLAFGPDNSPTTLPVLNLSESADLAEAAHNLFAMLSELDRSDAKSIAVRPIPSHGLGAAINDRLQRAAHGARVGQSASNRREA